MKLSNAEKAKSKKLKDKSEKGDLDCFSEFKLPPHFTTVIAD
jgi:hypothetical protein